MKNYIRTGAVDIALNDQRRAFSDEYVNLILTTRSSYIEISADSPIAGAASVTPPEMKNTPCILVSSQGQREIEQAYYHDVVGFQGEFLFAENLEEARLLVIGGRGFMPVEAGTEGPDLGSAVRRIPLYRDGTQITRNYCAFWKKNHSGYYVEAFGNFLKRQFTLE